MNTLLMFNGGELCKTAVHSGPLIKSFGEQFVACGLYSGEYTWLMTIYGRGKKKPMGQAEVRGGWGQPRSTNPLRVR